MKDRTFTVTLDNGSTFEVVAFDSDHAQAKIEFALESSNDRRIVVQVDGEDGE